MLAHIDTISNQSNQRIIIKSNVMSNFWLIWNCIIITIFGEFVEWKMKTVVSWNGVSSEVKTIRIQRGIISIGNYAFNDFVEINICLFLHQSCTLESMNSCDWKYFSQSILFRTNWFISTMTSWTMYTMENSSSILGYVEWNWLFLLMKWQ